MNITVNSNALVQELRLINQITPVKSALPILTNVLLRADQHLYLYSSDHELGFSTACRAQVDSPGTCTLPAKRLLDLVEQLPDSDMSIFSDGRQAKVTAGSFRGLLQTMPAEDFPAPPPLPQGGNLIPSASLQSLVKRVRYAISEKGNFAIKGGLFTQAGKAAALVATDGKRLSIATLALEGEGPPLIFPTKCLDALTGVFNGGDITFAQAENHLFFTCGHRLLLSRIIDGQFPNYHRIIPREHPHQVSVGRTQLMSALRRVLMASPEDKTVYLAFESNVLMISSRSIEVGEAQEHLTVNYEADPLRLCLSGQFLLDFLEVAEGSSITLAFKDTQAPLLISDGQSFFNVIMLIRA